MRRMKIYLDISVISHLDTPDTPEKMQNMLRLISGMPSASLRRTGLILMLAGLLLLFIGKRYV